MKPMYILIANPEVDLMEISTHSLNLNKRKASIHIKLSYDIKHVLVCLPTSQNVIVSHLVSRLI